MNSLILALAPLGGLATALPAMAAAGARRVEAEAGGSDELRLGNDRRPFVAPDAEPPGHDLDGGYLLF